MQGHKTFAQMMATEGIYLTPDELAKAEKDFMHYLYEHLQSEIYQIPDSQGQAIQRFNSRGEVIDEMIVED